MTLDDEFIIEQAGRARRGNGAKFTRLWNGDAGDYRRADGSTDQNRADQALLDILAYRTQKDPVQMERLFKRSGLYRRDRWSRAARSGETYGQGSILLAIQHCHRVYDPVWAQAHSHRAGARRRERASAARHQDSNEDREGEAGHFENGPAVPASSSSTPERAHQVDGRRGRL